MSSVLRILRSLGPAGALANAAEPLDRRRREDLVVRDVARRFAVDAPDRTPLAA